jgi:hypothetical protein
MSEGLAVRLMEGRQQLPSAVGIVEASQLKMRQRTKIAEIRAALVDAGVVALDDQAATLGLCRSTAWSVLNPSHKSSGLSARTISRILGSSRLPQLVRQRLFEYVQAKIDGLYGHSERRRREFANYFMTVLREEFSVVNGNANRRPLAAASRAQRTPDGRNQLAVL